MYRHSARLDRQGRNGFTLLELIIAVVVLAVLATIAIPTFAHDIAASSVQRDATSLTSAANDVRSIATSEGIPPSVAPSNADVAAGLNEVSIATGPLEGTAATAPSDVSTGYGNVSYDIAGDQVGYAMLTSNGDCTMALTTGNTTASWSYESAIGDCDGVDALTGPGLASTPSSGGSGSGGSGGGDSSGTAPTAAPTGVLATAAGSTAAAVSWTDVPSSDDGGSSITGYTAVATSTTEATVSCTATSTQCAISGLVGGATYSVTVVATNVIGNSSPSVASSITLNSAPTAAPTSVSATEADGHATVTWTDVPSSDDGGSPITSYAVTSVQDSTLGCSASGTATSCEVTGLTSNDSYTFTVTASSTNGSGPTSTASNSVTADGSPAAPEAPTVTQYSTTDLSVDWSAPNDNSSPITGYTLRYSMNSGGSWATWSPGSTATTGMLTGLTNGATYIVEVAAVNADGTGAWSAESAPIEIASAPGAPTSVTASVASTTSALVSWTAPASNGGATITGYTATASPGGETCTSTGATLCTVTGLTDGDSYTFTVTATNSIGAGPSSAAGPAVAGTAATLSLSSDWQTLTFGDNQFLTTSFTTATSSSSPNGAAWTSVTGGLPAFDGWAVAFGDGKFVAMSPYGGVETSTNGSTWTTDATPPSNPNQDNWKLGFSDGEFVALGVNDTLVATSSNGTTWTTSTLPVAADWSSIAGNGAGTFVATSFTSTAVVSTNNGASWTAVTLPSGEWVSVAFGDGEFVAVTNTGFASSTNGTTWAAGTLPVGNQWSSVAFGDGEFVVSAESTGEVALSANGTTWSSAAVPNATTDNPVMIAFGNGQFVEVFGDGSSAEVLTLGLLIN